MVEAHHRAPPALAGFIPQLGEDLCDLTMANQIAQGFTRRWALVNTEDGPREPLPVAFFVDLLQRPRPKGLEQ